MAEGRIRTGAQDGEFEPCIGGAVCTWELGQWVSWEEEGEWDLDFLLPLR